MSIKLASSFNAVLTICKSSKTVLQIRCGRIYNILQMIRIIKLKINSLIQSIYKSRSLLSLKTSLLILIFLIIASPTYAAFPGTNGKIAFTSFRDGNHEIYTMNLDGSNPVNLTNNSAADFDPSWSPDGSKIIFRSQRDSADDTYIMNADGSNLKRLTTASGQDIHGSFSPDGTQIVFTSQRDGVDFELYKMNVDGSNQTRLTTNATREVYPKFSPDGNKILFIRGTSGSAEVYVMNSDGTNIQQLTTNSAVESHPDWSPDGTKIVFYSTRTGGGDIYTMNADGTEQVRITTEATIQVDPTWSPDGTKLIFQSNTGGDYEIVISDVDGSDPLTLTSNSSDDQNPRIQPLRITQQSSSASMVPPNCSSTKPVGSPQLFQIDTTGINATLHFSPVSNASSYFISYGYTSGDERFGTEFSLGNTDTAIHHTINALEPNTTYYFKVRSGNGCMPGDWSNNLKATTLYQNNTLGTKVFTAWEQMREVVEGWLRI